MIMRYILFKPLIIHGLSLVRLREKGTNGRQDIYSSLMTEINAEYLSVSGAYKEF